MADGFVRLTPDEIDVTARGHLFVRNIAMHFDRSLPGEDRSDAGVLEDHLMSATAVCCHLPRSSPDGRIHFVGGLHVIELRLQQRRLRLELLRVGLLRLRAEGPAVVRAVRRQRDATHSRSASSSSETATIWRVRSILL